MPRIRTIKPEFWHDYQLATTLTRDQRLLYIALWNEADDAGRFQAHPMRLKGAIFPYDDDIHGAFIEGSLRALAEAKKLVLYTVNGEPYAELSNFGTHQKINRPSKSRIPPPSKGLQIHSLKPHGGLTEDSLTEREGKGKERKGEEGRVTPTAAAVGSFIESVGSKWKLDASINEWAADLDGNPKYAGIDLVHEIQLCAEWHVQQGKTPKAPTSSIHNWLKRAKPTANGTTRKKRGQQYQRLRAR